MLHTLGESVHQQASSLEQIAGLEQVGTQAAARLQQEQHDRGEHELAQLERQAAETLGRIRELERAGQSQAERKSQLLAEAQTAQARIAVLQRANAENRAETAPEDAQRECQRIARTPRSRPCEVLTWRLALTRLDAPAGPRTPASPQCASSAPVLQAGHTFAFRTRFAEQLRRLLRPCPGHVQWQSRCVTDLPSRPTSGRGGARQLNQIESVHDCADCPQCPGSAQGPLARNPVRPGAASGTGRTLRLRPGSAAGAAPVKVSYHLGILRETGLVRSAQRGKNIYYTLQHAPLFHLGARCSAKSFQMASP